MLKQKLLQKFTGDTTGKNLDKGRRVYSNDLITKHTVNVSEDLIVSSSNVISEGYLSEYVTKLEFDRKELYVISTYCTCQDFERNELVKNNYACKHVCANFISLLNKIDTDTELHNQIKPKENKSSEPVFKSRKEDLVDFLLKDTKKKHELKFDIYISKAGYKEKIYVEFKIGLKGMASNKLYSLKDIDAFLTSYHNKFPTRYGKDFTFNMHEQSLSLKDRQLIEFIEMLKDLQGHGFVKRDEKFIDGKRLYIPPYMLRDFLLKVRTHRVFLNDGFYMRPVDTDILLENPPFEVSLRKDGNNYLLSKLSLLPETLNGDGSIYLAGSNIYISSLDFKENFKPYMELFKVNKDISLPATREHDILTELVPRLGELVSHVNIASDIREKVVSEPAEFQFYFDREGKEIKIDIKVKYGKEEFNIFHTVKDKIIYRDKRKESETVEFLKDLGFDKVQDSFYFFRSEESLFELLKYDMDKFRKRGKVFYSENFKGIKNLSKSDIKGRIRAGQRDYLEFDFKIGDVSTDEVMNIFNTLKTNPRFFKLENGEFLDLEDIMVKEFIQLIGTVTSESDLEENVALIRRGRADYFQKVMEDKGLRFITGKNELKKITSKLNDIDKLTFEEPKNLNADLRVYQKIGFNWFKTLDYLGFGGILGDEMGLGKTLQAITFMTSEVGKRSLIVAPTSLIYNWQNEFSKFAPHMKVGVLSGDRGFREKIITDIDNYDVVITTYNLLKRDSDLYEKLTFDYMFIDEAQYIKNPSSQNAKVTKEIKATRKFALTGTPMENSLMELWSIFDFIMPGYLFDEDEFGVRYDRRLHEDQVILNDIHKLTRPFILRRLKKDVIKELPDKINKKIEVEMSDEQQKLYGSYAMAAQKIIKDEIKENGFKKSKLQILAYITKLRQLCLDPKVLINDYEGESCKVEALVEILHQSVDSGHKVLVFSQFTSVLKRIKDRLDKEGITHSYLDGSTKTLKRVEMVDEFNNGTNEVFLISLKAGGTGLNLTSADIVIHFDPWWNPAVEDQATDRAHRIGQENVVEVIKLIAKGTIEERIVELQEEKRELISAVLSDELSTPGSLKSLSEDDLLSLFS